ncbi:hypothetical protein DD607_27910, partial [Salmonella sp. 3DZ2-4SM]
SNAVSEPHPANVARLASADGADRPQPVASSAAHRRRRTGSWYMHVARSGVVVMVARTEGRPAQGEPGESTPTAAGDAQHAGGSSAMADSCHWLQPGRKRIVSAKARTPRHHSATTHQGDRS